MSFAHLLSVGFIIVVRGEERHGGFGEVAAFGDCHSSWVSSEDGADEAEDGGVVGEDADDVGAALDLFVDPLERVRRPDLAPVGVGEGGEGAAGRLRRRGAWRRRRGTGGRACRRSRASCSATAAASGWAKIVRIAAATISAEPLGTWARTLRMKWTRQRCQAAPSITVPIACAQAFVGVGDDQAAPRPGRGPAASAGTRSRRRRPRSRRRPGRAPRGRRRR